MAKKSKQFDPTAPHTHYCSNCYAPVYCAAKECEIPRIAECLTCKRGEDVERLTTVRMFFTRHDGYRKTWPGRDRESY